VSESIERSVISHHVRDQVDSDDDVVLILVQLILRAVTIAGVHDHLTLIQLQPLRLRTDVEERADA